MNADSLPDSHDLFKRIEAELIDGYDEEFEMEIEDRRADEALGDTGRTRTDEERQQRRRYFRA